MSWNLVTEGTKEVYVSHVDGSGQRQFVARFKYAKPRTNARAFVRFLMAHFTPDEYFAAYNAGPNKGRPLSILHSRGYVSPNERAAARYRIERDSAEVTRECVVLNIVRNI